MVTPVRLRSSATYSLVKTPRASSLALACIVAPCLCYAWCLLRLMSLLPRDRRQQWHTPTVWRPPQERASTLEVREFLLETAQSARGRHKHGATTGWLVQGTANQAGESDGIRRIVCCAVMASSQPAFSPPHTDKRAICPRLLEQMHTATRYVLGASSACVISVSFRLLYSTDTNLTTSSPIRIPDERRAVHTTHGPQAGWLMNH